MDTHAYKMSEGETIENTKIDGSKFSETLKLSNLFSARAESCVLIGGVEDCLDVVRGYGEFDKIDFIPTSRTIQSVTCKGGCMIYLKDCMFYGKAKKADIVVGDFTIYDSIEKDRIPSKLVISNCKGFDDNGKERPLKITIVRGDLVNQSSSESNLSVRRYPSFLVKIYFFLGRLFTSKKRKSEAKENLKEFPDKRKRN